MNLNKVTLKGIHTTLVPLELKHAEGISAAIEDGKLWELFVTRVPRLSEVDTFIKNSIKEFESGETLAFATFDNNSGKIVGSTRFMRIDCSNKRLEIGFTFISKSFQRTAINTEAKMLMLTHAFEELGVNRVELLTDYLNQKSRKAILRLGAKQEGILRNHMLMPDGRVRDSVLFSIIANEWPGVRQNLAYKMKSYFE